jgi:hypothetical protein
MTSLKVGRFHGGQKLVQERGQLFSVSFGERKQQRL